MTLFERIRYYRTVISKYRFPRSKYLRQLRGMQDELRWWQSHYALLSQEQDSAALSGIVYDKSLFMDALWHEIQELIGYFEYSTTPLERRRK